MTTITIIDGRDTSELIAKVTSMLADGPVQVKLSGRRARSLSQNALSWVWYGEISRWLASKGKDFADPQWVHDAMCHTFLGHEDVMDTDVVTGVSARRSALRGTSKLDAGEMKLYLDMVHGWAMNYGLLLTTPEDSEYMRLSRQENGCEC